MVPVTVLAEIHAADECFGHSAALHAAVILLSVWMQEEAVAVSSRSKVEQGWVCESR